MIRLSRLENIPKQGRLSSRNRQPGMSPDESVSSSLLGSTREGNCRASQVLKISISLTSSFNSVFSHVITYCIFYRTQSCEGHIFPPSLVFVVCRCLLGTWNCRLPCKHKPFISGISGEASGSQQPRSLHWTSETSVQLQELTRLPRGTAALEKADWDKYFRVENPSSTVRYISAHGSL